MIISLVRRILVCFFQASGMMVVLPKLGIFLLLQPGFQGCLLDAHILANHNMRDLLGSHHFVYLRPGIHTREKRYRNLVHRIYLEFTDHSSENTRHYQGKIARNDYLSRLKTAITIHRAQFPGPAGIRPASGYGSDAIPFSLEMFR